MKAMLDAQDVWETVESAEKEEFNPRKDKKARAYILQSIPEDVLLQIAKKKTAKEIWESLKTRYLSANRVKKARLQILKNEFDALRMKEHESIDEFARKVREAPCRSKRRNDDRQYTDATPDEPALLFFMSQEKTREERVLQMFHQDEVKTATKDVWYLDNDVSNHMTGRREMFLELDEKITGKMTENGSEVNMVGDAIKVYDNGKLLMFVKRTSNRLYKISLELAKPICLLPRFEKPEGVAGATNSAVGAACSPPAKFWISPTPATVKYDDDDGEIIDEQGRGDSAETMIWILNTKSMKLDEQNSEKVRNLFRLRKTSMGEEADCIHASTAERNVTRKEVLEKFMKVGKEREALLTNLQTKVKSLEEKFARTQKQERPSYWHHVRSSL
ncbi:hypothetical protein AKJ16_DCAP23270 [Drosera capensis]